MNYAKHLLAYLTLTIAVNGHAASLSLVPMDFMPSYIINGPNEIIITEPNPTLTFGLFADFSDETTLGGGYSIRWDTNAFELVSFTASGEGDASFTRDPTAQDGLLFDGAIGSFGGLPSDFLIGTVVFQMTTAAGGNYVISPLASTGTSGPWVSFDLPTQFIDVDYNAMRVRIIPIPGAIWFMVSGLMAVATFRRR
ncbi:MAG: hypothetical protein AAF610_09275 [Pseudomonadota bacterium]